MYDHFVLTNILSLLQANLRELKNKVVIINNMTFKIKHLYEHQHFFYFAFYECTSVKIQTEWSPAMYVKINKACVSPSTGECGLVDRTAGGYSEAGDRR